jgi:hypothetical protein
MACQIRDPSPVPPKTLLIPNPSGYQADFGKALIKLAAISTIPFCMQRSHFFHVQLLSTPQLSISFALRLFRLHFRTGHA